MPTPLASPRRDGEGPPPSRVLSARWPEIAVRARRCLTIALLAALVILFVEVPLESWVQELFGHRSLNEDGKVVGDLPGWPKHIKNGLLLSLVGLSAAKITVERRWREFK